MQYRVILLLDDTIDDDVQASSSIVCGTIIDVSNGFSGLVGRVEQVSFGPALVRHRVSDGMPELFAAEDGQ